MIVLLPLEFCLVFFAVSLFHWRLFCLQTSLFLRSAVLPRYLTFSIALSLLESLCFQTNSGRHSETHKEVHSEVNIHREDFKKRRDNSWTLGKRVRRRGPFEKPIVSVDIYMIVSLI